MSASSRQQEIMRAIRLKGTCAVSEIAASLSVSEETIRRDIKPMVAEGLVIKTHGKVTMPDDIKEPPFHQRMQENMDAKVKIAKAVARLIEDGETVFLHPGSTTNYVARALCDHRDLVILTNSAEISRTLVSGPGNEVYMAGGLLRTDDAAAVGPTAIDFIKNFRVQTAVFSIGAVTAGGLMDFRLSEKEFCRAVMDRAERVIVAVDHTKFERKGIVHLAELGEMDLLVTDQEPPKDLVEALDSLDVEWFVAS
ncbi:DeoR/GlpR family DNA-binding transcription regulator [Kiloniella laminariae]|uniref:DeoR/GlpR family DNA-binding transcription regulator n=1 Tax=Kiloniella laminariae TaxID=454162 RepID=UPI00039EC922|nr:DeoR/GlpR family DNA-binding transcription regulator [Kiloniella laminariae]